MRRFLQPTTALLAALAVCAVLFGLGYAWRDLGQSAASAQQPATTGAPAAAVPAKPVVTLPAASASVPAAAVAKDPATDLQAALTTLLAAKEAAVKAQAALDAAKPALAQAQSKYDALYAALFGPPPGPKPLNPDGIVATECIVVASGPWSNADATAAAKAGNIRLATIDATSASLTPVNQRWVAYAKASGPLPWFGLVHSIPTGVSDVVYQGSAADSPGMLVAIKAFSGKPAAKVEPAPIVAPATAKPGHWESQCGPGGCKQVWKEDR